MLGLLVCLLQGASGCQPRPPDTKVGALCGKDTDCKYSYDENNRVVQLQHCALTPPADGYPADKQPRICTRPCQARSDCPVGFECLRSQEERFTEVIDDTDEEGEPVKRTLPRRFCFPCRADYDCPAGTFCEVQPQEEVADGGAWATRCVERAQPREGFGTDCAIAGDSACDSGFFCHRDLPDDPDAYCTKECKLDVDCPVSMFCGTADPDNLPSGRRKRCLRREQCSSCRSDAECTGLNSLCVLDDRGRGYCTRACNPKSTMPCTTASASRGHLECRAVARDPYDPKDKRNVCAPRFGRCYDNGDVCDPCRPHMPEDCQQCGPEGCKRISGRSCVRNDLGEGVCRQSCDSVEDCGENARLDAERFYCDLNQSSENAQDKSCTADSRPNSRVYLKRLTCWP